MGVEPIVSRGDTIKLSGRRTHRVSWGHVQTFMLLGHKEDEENARAGGDTSVQDGGCSYCKQNLATGKQRSLRDKESL